MRGIKEKTLIFYEDKSDARLLYGEKQHNKNPLSAIVLTADFITAPHDRTCEKTPSILYICAPDDIIIPSVNPDLTGGAWSCRL